MSMIYSLGEVSGGTTNPADSFRLFQGKVLGEYDRLVDEYGLEVVNAVGSITDQQRVLFSGAPHFLAPC